MSEELMRQDYMGECVMVLCFGFTKEAHEGC